MVDKIERLNLLATSDVTTITQVYSSFTWRAAPSVLHCAAVCQISMEVLNIDLRGRLTEIRYSTCTCTCCKHSRDGYPECEDSINQNNPPCPSKWFGNIKQRAVEHQKGYFDEPEDEVQKAVVDPAQHKEMNVATQYIGLGRLLVGYGSIETEFGSVVGLVRGVEDNQCHER